LDMTKNLQSSIPICQPCSCPSFLGSASTASGATANVLAAAWRVRLSLSCKHETISGRFFLKRPTSQQCPFPTAPTRGSKICLNWCVFNRAWIVIILDLLMGLRSRFFPTSVLTTSGPRFPRAVTAAKRVPFPAKHGEIWKYNET